MPVIFPSVDWFEELKRRFNSAGRENQVGGGTCDALVGVACGERVFTVHFEGFECTDVVELDDELALEKTDFYLELHPDDWKDMIVNIRENDGADLSFTLNTLDLELPDGLAKSWTDDQYRQDLFFRFNQTFQYFFDASCDIETVFEEIVID